VRVVLAALVLTAPALLLLRGRWDALRRSGRVLAVYGVAAVAGAQLCYFMAVQHLSVAVALLLEYSGALLVVLWVWLRKGQQPGRLTLVGALAAALGLALVLDIAGNADLDPVGVLWGLGAAVGLAVYFVVSAEGEDALPPLVMAWGGLAVGGAVLASAGAVGVLPLAAPRTDVVLLDTEVSWLVPVLGLVLVAAVIAYVAGIIGRATARCSARVLRRAHRGAVRRRLRVGAAGAVTRTFAAAGRRTGRRRHRARTRGRAAPDARSGPRCRRRHRGRGRALTGAEPPGPAQSRYTDTCDGGLGRERSAGPVAVPGLEPEAGQLRHEVQLSRPDVAVRAAEHPRLPARAELEVVRDHELVHHVVGVQARMYPGRVRGDGRVPSRGQRRSSGDPQLDDEPTHPGSR
jgi:drug/metabolite transporter (DMT)-like permease